MAAVGCTTVTYVPGTGAPLPPRTARAGDPVSVAFAVAWCADADPAKAGESAAGNALRALGCPAKGLVFFEYFPRVAKDKAGEAKEVPDPDKERKALAGVRAAAGNVPMVGCRARSLVNGGTQLGNSVAVLAIGGERAACKAVKEPLAEARYAVGRNVAQNLKGVDGLGMILALSEMNLCFDTNPRVSVDDFIRGVQETAGRDVVLFGGNCMPNDYESDKGGVQFFNNEALAGHVVALGIGGPVRVVAGHYNEFEPSHEIVTVTKAEDKWVYEFDGRPAGDVYRRIRGMASDDEFTSDWQHPIGVVVAPFRVYLRMVLEEDKERKALRFVAPVPVGTRVKILKGGADANAILRSAAKGTAEMLRRAGDAKPLAILLSSCCARGMRLAEFGRPGDCEIAGGVVPALGRRNAGVPIFGFYAWGELGPIAGPFNGLTCMYQQHTFVSAMICERK
ncbi:MAG TPA: FIST N-terminal domain-containing protein [Planctomycetota bacterium]|nr:FIST N-terminal domain-containing protein [Planctomycetota bacterium]HRR79899.1 FIST N-terminal domain-containing protein [Planctomycetota bacterium]HRT95127.1 FIST N-terminal domain-containing protein [Planctomycetota bacterium]